MEGRMSDWRASPPEALQDESDLCRACIESNFKTRMIVIVPVGTTAAEFKEKIRRCHIQNFPELGGVRVTKLMILVFGFWYTFNEGSIGVLSRGTDARFKAELEREEPVAAAAAAVGGICGTCLKDVRRNCSSSQNNFDRIKSLEVSPPVAAVSVDAGLAVTPGAEDAREFVCRALSGARRQLSHAREEGGKGGESRRDVEEEPILTGLTAVEKETPKTAEKILNETPETAEKRKVVVDEDPKVADEGMPDPAEKRRPIEDEAPKAAEEQRPTEAGESSKVAEERRLIEEEAPEVAEKTRPAEDGETTKAAEKQKPAEDLETAEAAEKKSAEVVERTKAAEKKKPAEDVERAKAAEPVHDVEAAKAAETRKRFGDVETARTAENEKPVDDGKAAARAAEVEDETLKTAESEDVAIDDVRQKSVVSKPSMSEDVIDNASRKRKADPPLPDLPAKMARVDSATEDSSDSMDEESNQSAQVERGNGKKLDREMQAKHAEKLEAQEELEAEEELGAGSKQGNSEEVDKAVLDGGQDVKNDFTQRSVDSIVPPQDLCTSKNVDDVCNNLITQHFSDSSISNSAEASSASEDSGHQAPKAVVSKAAASKPAAKTWKLADDSDSESSEDAPDPQKFFKGKGASQKSKVGLIVPNTVDSEEDEGDQQEKKRDVVSKRSTEEEPLKAKAVQAPAAQVNNRQGPVLSSSSSSTEMSSDSESSSTDPCGSPAKGNPRRTGVDTRFQHFVDKNDGLEQLFNFKLNLKRKEVANNTADVVYETQDIDGEVHQVVQKADESSKAKQKTQKGRKPKAVLETSEQTKQKAAKSKAVRDSSEQQNDFQTPVAKPAAAATPATTPAATPATTTPAGATAAEVLPSTKTKRKPGEDAVPKTKTLKKPRQETKSPPVVDGILAPKPLASRKTKVPCPICGKLYVGKSTSYLNHTKTCTGPAT